MAGGGIQGSGGVLSIGELAAATATKVPTIRYYETIGLLPPPARTEGNQRRYAAAHQERLAFIRHARALGFDVPAIRDLLRLVATPDAPCAEADAIARRHLADVEARISQLDALRTELARMVACGTHGTVSDCRVVQALVAVRPEAAGRRASRRTTA